MPNYFSDNPDLLFQFGRLNLQTIVALLEDDYRQVQHYEHAPHDYSEAMENYKNALELVGDIAGNFIAPRSGEIDREGAKLAEGRVIYPKGALEAYEQLGNAGLLGIIVPRKYGGSNFPATIYTMMVEMISRADAGMMTLFGYQDVAEAIARFGEEEAVREPLGKYCRGESIAAMVLTEPEAGSDLQAVRLEAYQDSDGQWFLRGVKRFISNGCGDMLLVLARSEPNTTNLFGLSLFLCSGENVKVNRIEEKLGLHGSPTCELYFEDAPAVLIGRRRYGLIKYVMFCLNHARFSVTAQAIGIAEAAYAEALSWSKQRRQFGKTIYEMPPVANILVDMRVALESSRTMLYAAVPYLDLRNNLEEKLEHLKKIGEPVEQVKAEFERADRIVELLSPMVKYRVTEYANKICFDALQLHGGSGYMRESRVEQLYRDVRITNIYEGTSQVQIGSASKGVLADVLEEFFAERDACTYPEELESSVATLREVRQTFLECLQIVTDHPESRFRDAAAKELVDMYADLFAGYHLLAEAQDEERKRFIAGRFILTAHANAQKSRSTLRHNRFADLQFADEICIGA